MRAGAEAGGEEIKLPAAGDELYGFRVTDITPFPQKNAQLVSLDHLKSGAEVLYIACDSPDKAVNVRFGGNAYMQEQPDGSLRQVCDEGVLAWVPVPEVMKLSLWEGDRIFLRYLTEGRPFFHLRLHYHGDSLQKAEEI